MTGFQTLLNIVNSSKLLPIGENLDADSDSAEKIK